MRFFNSTKEPTEMDRVMESITQTENEIRGRIYQLGEMFYQANKSKARGEIDEQYYAVIDLINKQEHNRRGYYKNKLRLEGQMMCEHCGAVIPYGSMFCNICGQRADGQETAPGMGAPTAAVPPLGVPVQTVPGVGAVPGSAVPSMEMGSAPAVPPMEMGSASAVSSVEIPAAAAIPPVGAEMAPAVNETTPAQPKCSQCGAVLGEGSLFCESCGAKVQ